MANFSTLNFFGGLFGERQDPFFNNFDDFDDYEAPTFRNATEIQLMISVINGIGKLVGDRQTFVRDEFGTRRLANVIDYDTIAEYSETAKCSFCLDSVLNTIEMYCGRFFDTIDVNTALEFRDELVEEWLAADLLVEGLNSDSTTLENVSSGLPVILSKDDFNIAFEAFAETRNIFDYV